MVYIPTNAKQLQDLCKQLEKALIYYGRKGPGQKEPSSRWVVRALDSLKDTAEIINIIAECEGQP